MTDKYLLWLLQIYILIAETSFGNKSGEHEYALVKQNSPNSIGIKDNSMNIT